MAEQDRHNAEIGEFTGQYGIAVRVCSYPSVPLSERPATRCESSNTLSSPEEISNWGQRQVREHLRRHTECGTEPCEAELGPVSRVYNGPDGKRCVWVPLEDVFDRSFPI